MLKRFMRMAGLAKPAIRDRADWAVRDWTIFYTRAGFYLPIEYIVRNSATGVMHLIPFACGAAFNEHEFANALKFLMELNRPVIGERFLAERPIYKLFAFKDADEFERSVITIAIFEKGEEWLVAAGNQDQDWDGKVGKDYLELARCIIAQKPEYDSYLGKLSGNA